jgi:hypothetical protein
MDIKELLENQGFKACKNKYKINTKVIFECPFSPLFTKDIKL